MRNFETELYSRLPKKEQKSQPNIAELCGSVGLFKARDNDDNDSDDACILMENLVLSQFSSSSLSDNSDSDEIDEAYSPAKRVG